jgi:hypothetical protein
MKVNMTPAAIDSCVKELRNLGFREVHDRNELEDMQLCENSRIWNFRDKEVDYTVLFKADKNVWDLYAYALDDYLENYDYVLVAKPDGPSFRTFFNNFRVNLRNSKKTKRYTNVRK